MKTITYTLFTLLFMLATAIGQARADETPDYVSTATGEQVRLHKGRVEISFTLDLGERVVYTNHRRIVTPVLVSADGRQEASLPSVIVSGRNRAIQEEKARRDEQRETPVFVAMRGNKPENRVVSYQASADYQPWMDDARLSLREEVVGCRCGELLQAEQVLRDPLLYRPVLRPSAETVVPRTFTPRSEERDAFLIYPVDQTRLYPDRYSNRTELAKIDSALQFVRHNPAYQIQRIYLSGYASPEGSFAHNRELAEGRAEALRRYVLRQYDLPDTLLVVTRGDENWTGLAEAVARMELPNRDALLEIIRSDEDPDRREARLKQADANAYALLLRTVYPALRKNTFRISYISRERTPQEARRLAEEQPGELNAYEFYTVARTYCANDSAAYGDLLLKAADTYPDNAEANNNAARICLTRGDLEAARKYLDRTNNEPFTWNNRGVLLWMQGRREEALFWLRKAADEGDPQARENLKEIDQLMKNFLLII